MRIADAIRDRIQEYHILPESADLPKESKERHIKSLGMIMAGLSKTEVRIRHHMTAFKLGNPR